MLVGKHITSGLRSGLVCDLAASMIAMYVNLHDDKDDNNYCFNALYGMYCLFGNGFASWQSTASGSIITEIMEDTSSRSVVIAFLQVQR